MVSRRVLAVVGFLLADAAFFIGCGATCSEVERSRERVRQELDRRPAGGAHLRLRVPLDTINRSLAEVLERGAVTVPIEIPAPRGLPLPKTRSELRVRSLKLEPTERGHLRFAVRAAVMVFGKPVFHFSAVADAEPHVVRRGDATFVELRIGLGDVASFRPHLPDDAADRMVRAVLGNVSALIRDRLPRSLVRRLGDQALERIAVAGVRRLQQSVEDWLGTKAQIRFRLPDVPIAKVRVASDRRGEGALVVMITTTLPIAHAVSLPDGDATESSAITVTLSADAAMVLANWAIESGRAPQRYNRDLEPMDKGQYRPLFHWKLGDPRRPLKVHIIRDQAPCSYIRVAFAPLVELRDGKLAVTLANREIEEAQGPMTLELGAKLSNLLGLSLETTKKATAMFELTVGDLMFKARTRSVSLEGDSLTFELEAGAVVRDAT